MAKHYLDNIDPAPLNELFDTLIANQPWYKRYANTVATVVGSVLNAAWLIIASGVELPPQVIVGVSIVGFIAQVIGIKNTGNGVTEKLRTQVLAANESR